MSYRSLILILALLTALVPCGTALADVEQPVSDYQAQMQKWEEDLAEHQQFRWIAGGILVALLVYGVLSYRRYTQSLAKHDACITESLAKYEAYLKDQQERGDQFLRILESIERRLSGEK